MEPSTPQIKRCGCGEDYMPVFGDGDVCTRCRPNLVSKSYWATIQNIPDRYRGANYDDLKGVAKQVERGRAWAHMADHSNSWLTIQGSSGNGKTHLAACILKDYAQRYVKDSAWINAAVFGSEVLDMTFRGGVGNYVGKYTNPYLLVIDDLGVEGVSESIRTAMYRLINTRWERRVRTIVTTNLSLSDISTKLGQQIADRLLRTGRFIKFDGESYAWQQIHDRQKNGDAPRPALPAGTSKAGGNACSGGAPSILKTPQERSDHENNT